MKRQFIIPLIAAVFGLGSCADLSGLESEISDLENRVSALEEAVAQANANAIAAKALFDESTLILGVNQTETGYDIELSNGTSVSIYTDVEGLTPVIGVDEDGNWTMQYGDSEPEIIEGTTNAYGDESIVPVVRVSADGYWELSINGGSTWSYITDSEGNPVKAAAGSGQSSFFSAVSYNAGTGELSITLTDGRSLKLRVYGILTMEVEGFGAEGETILLGEVLHFPVTFSDDVTDVVCGCPEGWRVQVVETGSAQELIVTGPATGTDGDFSVSVKLISAEGYVRVCTLNFTLKAVSVNASDCQTWNKFLAGAADNVLVDFSYAGYNHGETAPPEVIMNLEAGTASVGGVNYKIYDITDYGAVPNDGISDRDAFISLVSAIAGEPVLNAAGTQLTFPHKNQMNAVIYFPEGDFILHTSDDDVNGVTQSMIVRGGNLVLKGAGRDKTTITMASPALPTNPSTLYSSPDMLQLKHNTGIQYNNTLATVTGDSAKGEFSVTVDGATGISAGDWVCLYLAPNNAADVVAEELYPYSGNSSWEIVTNGVNVEDLHQVKSVSGNTVTFVEPLMHSVKASWGWTIVRYQHYENVGVEDMTWVGNAKENFDHHASWEDDGAYKPLSMNRLANSWIRRVGFRSVSEACSVISSANVSVYDAVIDGNRGHSAIRSQGSSRVFIGAVTDKAEGYMMDELGHDVTGEYRTDAGQYHAVGVSKQSMGAVLWRNVWGYDSCFESHATQPRATLIDCCTGGWRRWRQGGDATQMPNHLGDLVVWNFENISPYSGEWIWWDNGSSWWKFLPPVVVGFHGQAVTFDESTSQVKVVESNGAAVSPESLYEAQLRERLGYVPAWLNGLK